MKKLGRYFMVFALCFYGFDACADEPTEETQKQEIARLQQIILENIKTISDLRRTVERLQNENIRLRELAGVDKDAPILVEDEKAPAARPQRGTLTRDDLVRAIRNAYNWPSQSTELQQRERVKELQESLAERRVRLQGLVKSVDMAGNVMLSYNSREEVPVGRSRSAALVGANVVIMAPRETVTIYFSMNLADAAKLRLEDSHTVTGTIKQLTVNKASRDGRVVFSVSLDAN